MRVCGMREQEVDRVARRAKASISPTVRSRRLGDELRQLREAKKWSLETAANTLNPPCSISRLQRIERGEIKVRPGDVYELTKIYGASPELEANLVELAANIRVEGWWGDRAMQEVLTQPYMDYIGFETVANKIRAFESAAVHGLLQTRDYAHAVEMAHVSTAEEAETAERMVEARINRQSILDRRDPPLKLTVVMDEAVLHRRAGGPKLMYDQLTHLQKIAREYPNVTIQIISFGEGYFLGTASSFALLTFPDPRDRSVAFGFQPPYLGGDRMFEKPDEIRAVEDAFDDLRGLALTPDASLDLIQRMADRLST